MIVEPRKYVTVLVKTMYKESTVEILNHGACKVPINLIGIIYNRKKYQ